MSTPDVFLPTLYTVVRLPYIPGAVSKSGNTKDTWGNPVEYAVYGWGPPESTVSQTDVKEVFADDQRYLIDILLMVPPGFVGKHRDRFILGPTLAEYQANPEGFEVYKQIGPLESYEANPFGWNPGSVGNLVAVEGAR